MRNTNAKASLFHVMLMLVCFIILQGAADVQAGFAAFEYDPIGAPIISATFTVDVASLVAHRTVSGNEVNWAVLVDPAGAIEPLHLSDDLFGMSAWPAVADVNQGVLETGLLSAAIDPSFFPVLANGQVGLQALFTDTDDAKFAIDFISLTIETSTESIESFYGFPAGNENNGFGIGLMDGDDLPSALPGSLPIGATGTGFDETISSKGINVVPEPATLSMIALCGLALMTRRAKTHVGREHR